MTIERNKAIATRFVEDVWNDRNYDVIDELFSDTYTGHWFQIGGSDADRADLRQFISNVHEGFSDFEMESVFVHADEEYVTCGFHSTGTHDGMFMGISPDMTDQSDGGVTPGHITFRIEDGEIVEGYSTWDALGLFMQLGLIPEDLTKAAPAADD